jgi:hypothetical protein
MNYTEQRKTYARATPADTEPEPVKQIEAYPVWKSLAWGTTVGTLVFVAVEIMKLMK